MKRDAEWEKNYERLHAIRIPIGTCVDKKKALAIAEKAESVGNHARTRLFFGYSEGV